jgi:hypothetical protein
MDIAELGFRVDTRGLKKAASDIDRLDKSSARAEKSTKGLSKSLKFIGGLGIGAALAGIAKGAFDTFRSFEQMKMSLKTVVGSAEGADRALSKITEFAKETPYTLDQSVQGFQKLKALGLDPSISSLRSYGNTAAAMGKDMMQMIEAVADASTGEFERLKEFGIKAKSEGDKVSFTFQGITKTVGKNSKEIQQYLLDIGNNTFGTAMSDQMDTVNGALSNLSDSWYQFQIALAEGLGLGESGKELFKSLAGVVSAATAYVKDAAIEWAFFVDNLKYGDGIYAVVRESFNYISDGLASIMEFISPVTDLFKKYSTEIGEVVATLAGSQAVWALVAGGVGLITTAVTAMSGALVANPIVALITAIGMAAYVIYDNWDGISQWFSDLWTDVKQWFSDAWSGIEEIILNYTPQGLIYSHWDKITLYFSDLWAMVSTVTRQAWDGIKSYLADIGSNLMDGLINGLKNQITAVVDTVGHIADSVINKFKSVFDIHSPSKVTHKIGVQTGEGLENGIIKGGKGAVNAAQQVADDVNSTLRQIGEGIVDDIFDKLLGKSGKSWGDIGRGIVNDLVGAVTGSIKTSLFGGSGGLTTIGGGINPLSGGGLKTLFGGLSTQGSLINRAGALLIGNQIGEGISSVANMFGTKIGNAFAGAAEMTNFQLGGAALVGGLIGSIGQAGTGGGIGGALGSLGAVALGLGPIGMIGGALLGGAIGGLFGGGKQVGSGYNLGYAHGGVTGGRYVTTDKGWLRGESDTPSDLDPKFEAELNARFDVAEQSIIAAADRYGYAGAKAFIDQYSSAAHKMDDRDLAEEAFNEWFDSVTDGMIRGIFGTDIDKFVRAGERLSQAFNRISTATGVMETALASLGSTMELSTLSLGNAASVVIEGFGGVEKFNAIMETVKSNLNAQLQAIADAFKGAIAYYKKLQADALNIRKELSSMRLGANSALTVVQQHTVSRSMFDTTAKAAAGGDELAASGVVGIGKQYLTLAASQSHTRAEFMKAQAYVANAFNEVAGNIEALEDPTVQMVKLQEEAIAAVREELEQMILDAEVAGLALEQQTAQTDQLTTQTQLLANLPSALGGVINSSIESRISAARESWSIAGLAINGSHAQGLDYVPFDGYIAQLHKGERVVPANQNNNNDVVREIRALREETRQLKAELIKVKQINQVQKRALVIANEYDPNVPEGVAA